MKNKAPIIEIKNLYYRYANEDVLKNINRGGYKYLKILLTFISRRYKGPVLACTINCCYI